MTEKQMKVHLFGAISSPSCANFALKQTAIDNAQQFELGVSGMLLNDFYVDDLLKSFEDEKVASDMIHNAQVMCALGGFNLSKVVSNSRKVIDSLPLYKVAKSLVKLVPVPISTVVPTPVELTVPDVAVSPLFAELISLK